MKLKSKIALITGASTGIGRSIAIALAKQGVVVGLVARNQQALTKVQQAIKENKGQAEVFVADLSDKISLNRLIKAVKSRWKKIDILINVAGIWHDKNQVYANTDFETFSQSVIFDTYMVGTIAPTLLVHAFIPLMPKNSKIINISGTFKSGAKGWLPYYVSKRAIEDLTVGLAEELKEKSIQVNCISPADVATEAYKKFFPQFIKDAVTPEVVAEQTLFLCSKLADKITGKVFVIKKGKKPFSSFHF